MDDGILYGEDVVGASFACVERAVIVSTGRRELEGFLGGCEGGELGIIDGKFC